MKKKMFKEVLFKFELKIIFFFKGLILNAFQNPALCVNVLPNFVFKSDSERDERMPRRFFSKIISSRIIYKY